MAIDYNANKRYFRPFYWQAPLLIVIIGAAVSAAAPAGGVPLLLLGIAIIAYQVATRVPDQVIDTALHSQLTEVKGKALSKLNLDESQVAAVKPVIVGGYARVGYEKGKRGKDGQWRTSDGKAVVIFFDEHQLYAYSWAFSLINPTKPSAESTDEYFYRDVVSVSTATETWQPPAITNVIGQKKPAPPENYEMFKLTTSGGTSVMCALWGDVGGDSIRGARTLIAEKKRGLQ